MTLEEKIEHIKKVSMEEARIDGNKIIKEHRAGVDLIFNDHKEVVLRQANLSIKTKKSNAKQQLNRTLATYQTECKRAQGKVQTKLKQQLFEQVRQMLDDFMKTPEYDALLVKYIESAKKFAKEESFVVYLSPADEDKIAALEAQTHVVLKISKEDFIGGMRAVLKERNILIDHSFSSGLSREYEQFHFTGGDEHA